MSNKDYDALNSIITELQTLENAVVMLYVDCGNNGKQYFLLWSKQKFRVAK